VDYSARPVATPQAEPSLLFRDADPGTQFGNHPAETRRKLLLSKELIHDHVARPARIIWADTWETPCFLEFLATASAWRRP
jgi:hypothetical protein